MFEGAGRPKARTLGCDPLLRCALSCNRRSHEAGRENKRGHSRTCAPSTHHDIVTQWMMIRFD